MKVCYVDESGIPGEDEWFFLAGFIVDIEAAVRLDNEIDTALDLSWREEIHMESLKDLRAGDTFGIERRNELSDDLYNHLDSVMDYTVCAVMFKQTEMDLEEENQIYVLAFKYLLERFQWILERTDEYGSVYNDTHRLSSDIQEAHHHLQRGGSDYLDFDNIVGVAAPVSDELSRGIQMADLVASGIKAHFFDIESRYYVDYFLPHIDRKPTTGDIMGTGIKVFPDGVEDSLSYHPNREDF